MNLNELLDHSVKQWPRNAAVIDGERIVTYASLAEIISDLERRLTALALPPGSRVGLHVPNSLDYIVLTYALWRIQAVVIPIPVECPAEEITAITEQMRLELIVSSASLAGGTALTAELNYRRHQPVAPPDNHGLNLAFIRFTSGTTSARKGVALCHETIRDRVVSANKSLNIGPGDIVMWNLPMAHHFLITIVLYLSRGTTVVLSQYARPRSFLAEVNQWRATVLYAAPRFFGLLARDDSGLQLSTVRLAISTTSALSEDVAKDFFQRFNRPLIQALGVIELGLVTINLQDPVNRWNSAGRAAGDFCLSIAEPDADGCGELIVSGPGMLDAYVAPWLARLEILRNGWFHTGDIARIDAEGFVYLLSRKTSVINRAGQKIFPEEVEAVINRHPAVRESRVFGRQHPRHGEIVEADLVLEQADAELAAIREFCQQQLAGHKIPVQFHVVTELPKTLLTGKIRRA